MTEEKILKTAALITQRNSLRATRVRVENSKEMSLKITIGDTHRYWSNGGLYECFHLEPSVIAAAIRMYEDKITQQIEN